jgi:hypothetical protein
VTGPDADPVLTARLAELEARQEALTARMRELDPEDGSELTPEQAIRWLSAASEQAMLSIEQDQLMGREPGGEDSDDLGG